jgi:hypothetical protein
MHGLGGDDFAGFLGHVHRGDTFAAAIGEEAVFIKGGALAETVFAHDEQHGSCFVRDAAHRNRRRPA